MVVIDVQFRLQGERIPVDHGYKLYNSVCKIIPQIHDDDTISILPVTGRLTGDRFKILDNQSFLTIRLSSERIGQILPLAGKNLEIDGHKIYIGTPYTRLLRPYPRLYSPLVIIKGYMEPEPFLQAVQRQLDNLEIKGKASLVNQEHIAKENVGKPTGTHSPYLRRTINIKGKEVVGFALSVSELTAEESIRLQESGLGGRHRFGCGVFLPDRR